MRTVKADAQQPPDPPAPGLDPNAQLGAAVRAWYGAAPPAPPEGRAAVLAAVDAHVESDSTFRSGGRGARRGWPGWIGVGVCAASAAAVAVALVRRPMPAVPRSPSTAAAERDARGDQRRDTAPSPVELHAAAGVAVSFRVAGPGAARVALVGDFNQWNLRATAMQPDRDGTWRAEYVLPPGRHVYAFVIDGHRWLPDPAAPLAPEDGYGEQNSVVVVATGGGPPRVGVAPGQL